MIIAAILVIGEITKARGAGGKSIHALSSTGADTITALTAYAAFTIAPMGTALREGGHARIIYRWNNAGANDNTIYL